MLRAVADAWARASSRERRLIAVAGMVVLGGIGWTSLWQPMQADMSRLSRDLPRERTVLASARAQAADLLAVEKSPPAARGPMVPSIERALAERGLRTDAGAIDEKDARVRVNLASVRFDALVPLLDALSRDPGVHVVEATFTQRVEPGLVRAELVLAR